MLGEQDVGEEGGEEQVEGSLTGEWKSVPKKCI